ncbi:MAG: translation elongation factor EF-P [Planctomycetaceae bacterium]|nr:MAG: translation elongation factor EF-P [Planctomycetaceae bacterium]
MLAKDIKPGEVVVFEGEPIIMETLNVQTPSARGAATLYKFRGRNAVTRQKIDITLKGTESLDLADFARRDVQVMFTDATHIHLMDTENYNQFELPLDDIREQQPYMPDGLEGVRALIYNDECVGIDIPATVELEIIQCDPGVKGNSATSRTKPATLQTGLIVHVPEYIKQGERVKVDTRTGHFLSRA